MRLDVEPENRRRRRYLLVGGILLLCLLVAAIVVLALRGQGEPASTPSPTASASETPTPSPSPTPSETATPTPEPDAEPPSDAERSHFSEALESGNTAVFDQDFADTVDVIYVATECCGPISKAEAIQALDYVNPGSGATWNFHLDEATLASCRAGIYGEFFPVDAIVGQSSDGATVSFVPGMDGLIARILLSYVTPV